jgi:hypothetical protein
MNSLSELLRKAKRIGVSAEEIIEIIESTLEGTFDEALQACVEAVREEIGE